eukprot:4544613-Ditylum_brightwellii.AAC.1
MESPSHSPWKCTIQLSSKKRQILQHSNTSDDEFQNTTPRNAPPKSHPRQRQRILYSDSSDVASGMDNRKLESSSDSIVDLISTDQSNSMSNIQHPTNCTTARSHDGHHSITALSHDGHHSATT